MGLSVAATDGLHLKSGVSQAGTAHIYAGSVCMLWSGMFVEVFCVEAQIHTRELALLRRIFSGSVGDSDSQNQVLR